jgi:hypothetical protein
MLFIISFVGLAIFYLVDLFDGLNLAPPLALIIGIVILGLAITWEVFIPRNIPI